VFGYGSGAGIRFTSALLFDAETVPASFSTAATFPGSIAFVKVVGSASCGGASSVVTVPPGGVAAGNTLVLTVVVRGNSTGAVSVSDTRGNTYTLDVTSTRPNQGRTFLFSAHMATALVGGNTITVGHPNDSAEGVVVSEFSGIASSGRVNATAATNGNSAAPSAALATTGGPRLIVGAVGSHNHETETEPSGWATLQHLAQTCGTGNDRADNHSAYRIEPAAGTFTYNPTLSGSRQWYEAMVAYR
jgi:hypothetical protein